jgi:hypothetical protein
MFHLLPHGQYIEPDPFVRPLPCRRRLTYQDVKVF